MTLTSVAPSSRLFRDLHQAGDVARVVKRHWVSDAGSVLEAAVALAQAKGMR